ncbi:epididymal-specific lipocalin-9 [Phacochoerus africanus]|uniref:epididymal-specific lipocalin-9 n=1 Tax=Phacochoerus africanus TaxID=41426 RepID=UPI001FD9285C|nr:epididymal-specific lipocalin-9 [Phacochoerus africanus]
MALLLLSLWLSLVSAQDLSPRTIVRRNYDIARVSGTWYSISMASDDMKRIEENGDLHVFVQSIESLEDGRLKFNFHFMLHGECVEVAVVCDRTDRNGEYTLAYLGENRLLVSETDYRLFVTFRLQNIRNGTKTQVLALYGRLSELKPSFLHRFEKVCKTYGLGPENIISLSHQDPCYRYGR